MNPWIFRIQYQLSAHTLRNRHDSCGFTGISYSPVFLAPGQGKPFVQEI